MMKMIRVALTVVFGLTLVAPLAWSEEVKRPVQKDDVLEKARENFTGEAMGMMDGKAGSTYGVEGYDYLTGVGKRTGKTTVKSGDSGYAKSTGKTELWDRKKKATGTAADRETWVNTWSATFDKTLVPGADPNQGKQWYYFYCVSCHGWTGKGDGPNAIMLDPRPRFITKGEYLNKRTNLQLFSIIKGGGSAVELSDLMPNWGNVLQDQDIWNVVAFMRAISVEPAYTMDSNDVNPLNASKSAEFQDMQDLMEAQLGGRGAISGGGFVEGGNRKAPAGN